MAKLGQAVSMVESPKQEALLIFDKTAGEVTVSLRTHFHSGPTDLAWVIPVPAVPEDIREGDQAIFEKLEADTSPEFWVRMSGGLKFGCSGGESRRVQQSVLVIDAGTAGIFDYVVLNASEATALEDWLNDNRYRVPEGAGDVFRKYVDRSWHWLAIRLRAEVHDQANLVPHPVTYTYRSDHLEYPLIISRLSAANEIDMVLYVLAECEYGGDNWPNAILSDENITLDETSPSGTTYEAVFRQRTVDHGGHLLVTEFANDLDTLGGRPLLAELLGMNSEAELLRPRQEVRARYLTRLRAVVSKGSLDRDVILVPTRVSKYDFVFNSYHIPVERGSTAWPGISLFFAVVGIIFVVLRGRSQRV